MVPLPGTDFTAMWSMKLSMMVKPMPLRSSPPVVNMGCRAFSTSGMPRPRSLTLTSSTFPSQIFAFTSTLPKTLG